MIFSPWPQRIGMFWSAFLWWLELGGRQRELKKLEHMIEQRRIRLEKSWVKWERLRLARDRKSIQRELSDIERSLDERTTSLAELAEFVHQKRQEAWTVVRWVWQGHVDDKDGDPEVFLDRMGSHKPAKSTRKSSPTK